ncbi:hypothetical protein G6F31_015380 [Rhizopus arrhizus]|nr:hypothetical protein G6F31_015380 [Rhizopus arrhizus]
MMLTPAGASPRPEACDRIGQRIAERRGRTDAGQPDHPADLETGETAERLARIQVAATRLIEVAGGLRVAQHQQRDDDAGGDHAPQAEGPEQGDGGGRQQVDAAADHIVDRQADALPAADRALQLRFVLRAQRASPLSAGNCHCACRRWYSARGSSTKRGVSCGRSQSSSACMRACGMAGQPAVASPGWRHRWAKMQLPLPGWLSGLWAITKPCW